jgi:hypothetical protein
MTQASHSKDHEMPVCGAAQVNRDTYLRPIVYKDSSTPVSGSLAQTNKKISFHHNQTDQDSIVLYLRLPYSNGKVFQSSGL